MSSPGVRKIVLGFVKVFVCDLLVEQMNVASPPGFPGESPGPFSRVPDVAKPLL